MRSQRGTCVRFLPDFDRCEARELKTLVFIFNGNAFSDARPDALTAEAARALTRSGNRAVQVAYPTIGTVGAVNHLARRIEAISHGQPIGLMGFSAGGSIATRLAGIEALNVRAVLNFYGPPDLQDWLDAHRGDSFYGAVTGKVPFTPGCVSFFSGPSPTDAFVVNAFGRADANVLASVSTASFRDDFRAGEVFLYAGGHKAPITACPPAFQSFVRHL